MKRELSRPRLLPCTLLMLGLILVAGFTTEASAERKSGLFKTVSGIADGPAIPPEWAGVWAYTDSVFSCTGVFDFVETGNDTLCAGEILGEEGEGPVTDVTCNGSSDANTVSMTCSGSTEVLPDCQATFATSLTGTRTGETYKVTSQFELTFSGGALGCGAFPGFCELIRTTATRIGPEPTECSTAVDQADWGLVKQLYQ